LGWLRQYKALFICIVVSAVLYLLMGYHLVRSDFGELIFLYFGLIILYIYLLRDKAISADLLFTTGLFFRILLLFSLPALSQDFYRFIWDGRLLLHGYNPYLHLPSTLINTTGFNIPEAQVLFDGMGSLSATHYTNYPPVNQLCFLLAALLAGKSIMGSVVVFKLIIIGADIGIFFFGKKLLKALNLPEKNIFLYFLNPLVIIELAGNLHFEGVMIFFLIASLYYLHKQNYRWSAVFMAFSIGVKLVPLMLLPLFIRNMKLKKLLQFYFIIGFVLLISFLPFFSLQFGRNYLNTVALWFVNFEFNASIYYVIRSIGYSIEGYNIIAAVGKVTPFVIVAMVSAFSISQRNKETRFLIINMLLALSIYFFLSTTVHPWYIVSLIALSVFTGYKFPIVWSAVVLLSYYAYSNPLFKENSLLLFAEYTIVYTCFLLEMLNERKNFLFLKK
jgi:hypothetical protein